MWLPIRSDRRQPVQLGVAKYSASLLPCCRNGIWTAEGTQIRRRLAFNHLVPPRSHLASGTRDSQVEGGLPPVLPGVPGAHSALRR